MHHLEEELTCSVCFSMFDDPRILQCSHTFCRDCLENVNRSSTSYSWRHSVGQLKCPACRGITAFATGVNSLPVNFALKAIVEKYKSSKHLQHRSSMKTCIEHSNQLNMYCLKDRTLICGQCLTVGQHRGHLVDDPESAYTRERNMASKLLATLSDGKFTGVSPVIRALEEQMANCKNIVQEDKEEVVVFFDNLIELFEEKKQHFLSALNDLNQQVVDLYAPQIEAMKQIEDEELDLISLSSSAQEEESPLAYLENIHDIQQRMEALKKQPLLPVHPVDISPRVGQILKDQVLETNTGQIQLLRVPTFGIHFHKKDSTNSKITLNAPFTSVLFTVLLCITLIVLFASSNIEILPDFTTLYWMRLSEIMEPVLIWFGVYRDTVQTYSQRFADLYCYFISYVSSLLAHSGNITV
ncbi:tripartite motif-containing protein 59 [Pseudophryne corroboree]|uniref:tripartite motif-containing protein 59 n=1 Tax=Pseudophryne corroboree TaxID=495146 RepID=UPI0030814B61